MTGAMLLVLLAAEGVTILFKRELPAVAAAHRGAGGRAGRRAGDQPSGRKLDWLRGPRRRLSARAHLPVSLR